MTSASLVEGLRDPANESVWRRYVERYRPVVVGFARRIGCSADDAEDLAQETLATFAESLREGRYDPERGRLRAWLFGVARNVGLNFGRRRDQVAAVPLAEPVEGPNALEEAWDREWNDAVLAQCLAEVREGVEETTWEAFRLLALEGLHSEIVAERLGMSRNAVFGAKRRVLRRIERMRPVVEEIF